MQHNKINEATNFFCSSNTPFSNFRKLSRFFNALLNACSVHIYCKYDANKSFYSPYLLTVDIFSKPYIKPKISPIHKYQNEPGKHALHQLEEHKPQNIGFLVSTPKTKYVTASLV